MAKKHTPFRIGKVGQGAQPQRPVPDPVKDEKHTRQLTPFMLAGHVQPETQAYKMGRCTILISPPHGRQGWHLSISHKDRYPFWDEVTKARYCLLPEEINFVMILPPPDLYMSIHDNCFHLHEAGKYPAVPAEEW